MKLLGHPYRWILLIAISASMLLLLKINKRSFYFLYFKVIEEVELRNSQAVQQQAVHLQIWSQRLIKEVSESLPFLLVLLSLGAFVLFIFENDLFRTGQELALISVGEPCFLTPPIRAP